jgi:hypothetical protein
MEVVHTQSKAKVTNNSDRPYEEMFNGVKVSFKPGESQIWDWNEAVIFRGQFIPVLKDDTGGFINEKRIKVEPIPGEETTTVVGYQNPLTGQVFSTKAELDASMKTIRAGFTPIKEDEDSKVAALEQTVHAQSKLLERLSKQLETIENKRPTVTATKPGRSAKEKTDNVTDGANGRS